MVSYVDLRQRVVGLRPEVRTALGLTALLLAYGNGVSLFSNSARDVFLLWSNLALLAALLAWAVWSAGFRADELGLGWRYAGRSAFVGSALSVGAAAPPLLFIGLAPLVAGNAVEAPDISSRSGSAMAYFLLLRQPIGTALFEEASFRGVLYGAWQRVGGERMAIIATSVAFALWHVVITSRSVADSGIVSSPPAVAAGVVVSLAGLFVGGLIFAYLRWRTSSIAAPVAAHWLIVAAMAALIWAIG
jgi:membrane protease YdiL (CAAX protease family)